MVATRLGHAGDFKGLGNARIVVDFSGGALSAMAPRFDVTPVINASRGKVNGAFVIKVVGTNRWRAMFDLAPDGKGPIDLRCFLRLGDKTLSETWIYQYFS